MLKQTSTPTEMPVGLFGAPRKTEQPPRGFARLSARNLWHLLPTVIAELIGGFLWMPSRPHPRKPSGLGWAVSEKAKAAACILAFPCPVETAWTSPMRLALLATGGSHTSPWMVFGHPMAGEM